MSQNVEAADRKQYLSFSLAGSEYGIPILKVKEILQYETITRVPSTPRSVRGVINLRGSVVPVVDLAAKFGLAETPLTRWTCILIVEAVLDGQKTVMGVMSDAVREVIELAPQDVEPPPSFGTQVRVDHLLGMGKAGKRFVLLLDVDRVISADEQEFATHVREVGIPAEAPAVPVVADDPAPAAGTEAPAAEPDAAAASAAPASTAP
ncbi:MAG TPA: chemotaxis protein CheW [Anaeromyxobacteraceae bacterium]|nr:chemotaxis protein CheW [Anaeromyxobacteraceae bacterium]